MTNHTRRIIENALAGLPIEPILAEMRREALLEAAKHCDKRAMEWHKDYKQGFGPHRASSHREGMSDAAEHIADEIRALAEGGRCS